MHLPKGRVLSSILVPLKCCSFYWEHFPFLFLIICFTSDSLGLTFNPCSSHPCWGQLSIDSTHFHASTHWQDSLYTNTTHFFPPALGLHSWCRESDTGGCTAQRRGAGELTLMTERKQESVEQFLLSPKQFTEWLKTSLKYSPRQTFLRHTSYDFLESSPITSSYPSCT